MVRYGLYFSNDQIRVLRKISEGNGLSVSEHIRVAVTEYIERKKNLNVATSPSKRR